MGRSTEELEQEMNRAREKKNEAVRRMKRILSHASDIEPAKRALIFGLLASTEKRDAKIIYGWHYHTQGVRDPQNRAMDETRQHLKAARGYYSKAFEADRTQVWALVQEMAVAVVLGGKDSLNKDLWNVARELSVRDLHVDNDERSAWAKGNLIELYLLAYLRPDIVTNEIARDKALEYARQLEALGEDSIDVYTTRRQIERYTDWFNVYKDQALDTLVTLANEVLKELPFNPIFS